jgi:hypothetical protein
MKNILIIFFVFCAVLSSCSFDSGREEDNTPYFKFTPEEELKLVKPEIIGTSLKYKNQYDVVREFIINKCEIIKDAETSGGGFGFFVSPATVEYYFDKQETEATYADENGSIRLRIFFQNRPQTSKYINHKYVYSDPKFRGFIDFSIFNKNCRDFDEGTCGWDQFLYTSVIPLMTINGKEYKEVLKFISYNINTHPADNESNIYGRTVNNIYYSYDYCMIGYDEVDGTMWRIID